MSRVREEDVDVDGAKISCSEEERPEFRRIGNSLAAVVPLTRQDDRELVAKVVILVIRGLIPESAIEDVRESFEAKRACGDRVRCHGAWLWTCMQNQCSERGINFRQLLHRTRIPRGWLELKANV